MNIKAIEVNLVNLEPDDAYPQLDDYRAFLKIAAMRLGYKYNPREVGYVLIVTNYQYFKIRDHRGATLGCSVVLNGKTVDDVKVQFEKALTLLEGSLSCKM